MQPLRLTWAGPPSTPIRSSARGASRPCATSPSCSTATRCTGRTCVRAWAARNDAAATSRWQAELWRRLRARIGEPEPGRAPRPAPASAPGRAGARRPPARALDLRPDAPAGRLLQVLEAIAAHRDVHLYLLHPSPALWDGSARVAPRAARRAATTTRPPTLPANRLLASWGQDARELQVVLAGAGHAPTTTTRRAAAPDTLLAPPPGRRPGRRGARRRRRPARRSRHEPRDPRLPRPGPPGRGPARRDPARRWPTTRPSSRATSSSCARTSRRSRRSSTRRSARARCSTRTASRRAPLPPDLRVRLADRALRQTNPVLGVVARLLELADARVTASEVLDLADREPVRRRFRPRRRRPRPRWRGGSRPPASAGASTQRTASRSGSSSVEQAPGPAGLRPRPRRRDDDRGRRRLVGGVLPLDDVGSGDIDLAGRLAELVDRLGDALDALARAQPVAEWAAAIRDAADALTPRPSATPGSARSSTGSSATSSRRPAATGGRPSPSADVRALLAERLRGRPTRANFRTGHLTVCTLVPMRAVPHRVVCLLGLDDGVFPRKAPRDGDDLRLQDPHVGERDPRAEDRQLLLDALMAAGDRLVITYTGRDERTNAPRPPAVPVGELLDTVDRTVDRATAGRRASSRRPPPAPALRPGQLHRRRARRRRPVELRPRHPRRRPRTSHERPPPPPFLPAAPAVGEPVVELDDLVRFVQHPVRAFLRQRLDLNLGTGRPRSTTRSRSSWTTSTSGTSASGCSTPTSRAGAARSAWRRSPAATSRPASGQAGGRPALPAGPAHRRRGGGAVGGGPATSLDIRTWSSPTGAR